MSDVDTYSIGNTLENGLPSVVIIVECSYA